MSISKEAIENDIHNAFAELAQTIQERYGIVIKSVGYDWLDISSVESKKLVVSNIDINSTKPIEQPVKA